MSEHDLPDYYRTREQQSRNLAEAAMSPYIKAIHLQLAERYAHLAERGAETGRRLE